MTRGCRPIFRVAVGELLDTITILEIKRERIKDPRKLAKVTRELKVLTSARSRNISITEEVAEPVGELKRVNLNVWGIEDEIRYCERNEGFVDNFIALARNVYHTSDHRARLKPAEQDHRLGHHRREIEPGISY